MFPIPSLDAALAKVRAAFFAEQPGLNAWLWPNNIGPTAKVIAGEVWNVFNRLDFVGKQAFALYAEKNYLEDQGAMVGVNRKTAQVAGGNVSLTVTAAVAVAAGAIFQRGDGARFAASAVSIAGAGTLAVPVLAQVAGLAGVTQAGTPMTIVSGVTWAGALTASAAVDSSGLTGGADVEPDGPAKTSDLATYRGRILFRKRNPTQGGAPSDYVQWALETPGVTRVFVERCWAGGGTTRVFPLFDDLFTGGVPDEAHRALVDASLQALAPAACVLTTAAATPQTVAISVAGLNPPTMAARAAVTAEINDSFRRLGRVSGSNADWPSMPYLATPLTFLAVWAEAAVADAAGVIGAEVTVADTVIAAGSIPVPVVTFL